MKLILILLNLMMMSAQPTILFKNCNIYENPDVKQIFVKDGKIISAAQEERFTRKKHDPSYPFNAVDFVLKYSNINLSNVDHIVFYEKPFFATASKPSRVRQPSSSASSRATCSPLASTAMTDRCK